MSKIVVVKTTTTEIHHASPSFTRTLPGLSFGAVVAGSALASSNGPKPFNSTFLLMVAAAASDRSLAMTNLKKEQID